MTLSLLTVTKGEAHALPFLRNLALNAKSLGAECVVAGDGTRAVHALQTLGLTARVCHLESQGFIESVLDEAVAFCTGDYVLRLDDDERMSRAMVEWMCSREYEKAENWQFPRMHKWPNPNSVLLTAQLFPDHQTRLSVREKAAGRHHLHAPSPYGGGVVAPVAIEHHKFLVRDRADREETSRKWHHGDMMAFSLPEDVYDDVLVAECGDGRVPWTPVWKTMRRMSAAQEA